MPDSASAYDQAWNIIVTDWGNKPNSWQTAQSLVSAATMLYPFSIERGNPPGTFPDNGSEVVTKSGDGKSLSITGGHHDAGDYSRYTINSAHLIHTLIFAVDNFPGVLSFNNLGIPESGSAVNGQKNCDLLAEAKIEADFLYSMQDRGNVDDVTHPGTPVVDGGFYTLTYPQYGQYEDYATPDRVSPQHIVWPKTTSVTAAAVAALAEIGSSPSFIARYPNDAQNYMTAASDGWNFLMRAIAANGKTGAFQTLYS
jgi:Glycosyl hydrolase family 9